MVRRRGTEEVEDERSVLRHLSDAALIGAMRDGNGVAWHEFMIRFRPLLLRYGVRTGMDRADWEACVDFVLEESAMRWAVDRATIPKSITSYLLNAVKFRRMKMDRDAKRRDARYARAAREGTIDGAILSLCSEAAVRESYGPADDRDHQSSGALARFAQLLSAPLTSEERGILSRLGDGVPQREIAAALGVGYEAGRKRVQRLCARVRSLVPFALEQLSVTERAQVERWLERLQPEWQRGAGDVV